MMDGALSVVYKWHINFDIRMIYKTLISLNCYDSQFKIFGLAYFFLFYILNVFSFGQYVIEHHLSITWSTEFSEHNFFLSVRLIIPINTPYYYSLRTS
jgi:hypothetical protein